MDNNAFADPAAATVSANDPDYRPRIGEGPDVHLNVPVLKVDEISLEVDNLEAHVSLATAVLDVLRLNVGADVYLGKVQLEIKGVEAEAQLNVRLDNVAAIVNRVLTTLDRNPEILQHVGRGVESATRDIAAGTGSAVGELGKGAKGAVQDVGRGAGGAVEDVGGGVADTARDVGEGAGGAVQDVGEGAGAVAEQVGKGTAGAVESAGGGAAGAAGNVGGGADEAAEPETGQEETADREEEGSTVQNALQEVGGSVRDLGRALLRTVKG